MKTRAGPYRLPVSFVRMVHVITPSVAVITVSDVNRVDEEKRPLWTRVVVTPSSVVVADKVKSPVVMSSEPVPFLFDVGGGARPIAAVPEAGGCISSLGMYRFTCQAYS
jgi:hypothetical protein